MFRNDLTLDLPHIYPRVDIIYSTTAGVLFLFDRRVDEVTALLSTL